MASSSSNISRSGRKNLWHSKTLENKYERQLKKLINTFGHDVIELLKSSAQTLPDGTITIDFEKFMTDLEQLAQRDMKEPGKKITSENITKAFELGMDTGDADLAALEKHGRP